MFVITCRSIHLGYVGDTEVKGIPAFRFAPPSDVLAPPDVNPNNAGFCVPAGDCLGKGVLKVSVCRQGKPVVFVFSRFLQWKRCGMFSKEAISLNCMGKIG